eukprot:Rhum_TRINITY_DN14773_c29_g1::Rhum_TRINITY_DN14773_c29_g1_i1::g.117389::m.117389
MASSRASEVSASHRTVDWQVNLAHQAAVHRPGGGKRSRALFLSDDEATRNDAVAWRESPPSPAAAAAAAAAAGRGVVVGTSPVGYNATALSLSHALALRMSFGSGGGGGGSQLGGSQRSGSASPAPA